MKDISDQQWAVKAIVDANAYMTLATADENGLPWASPVWYASADYREFFWVSAPEAQHSRNISLRTEVGIVIFDSQQRPGTGQGVYMSATAAEVGDSDLDRGLAVFSEISQAQGLAAWNRSDVEPPARHRLYHAKALQHFVLSSGDARVSVDIS